MSLAETAASVDSTFTSIPIIDLGKCGTHDGKLATAHEIRDACIRVGFFYIRNHGIPQSCLDNVFAVAQTYFKLPMETKMKLYHKKVAILRGYTPPLDTNVDAANNSKGDFHEAFIVGWEEITTNVEEETRTINGATANVWPSVECPGFREACLEYYHAAVNVGKTLFQLLSLALELPETYFDDKTLRLDCAAHMKVAHYPLLDGRLDIDDNAPGVGAHTDLQCFTILWQQPEIQCLQAMNSEKRWINVPAIKDTLVINIGDQLEMWTNDVFKSTVHRVVNESGKERYSIPLFFGTDSDVKIEPLPSCVSAERPAKYSPTTAGEHLYKRLKETYHTT